MTSKPTLSAVIPVYNGEEYLAEAISSTLNQTRPPIECLVVDDGSTDATADVIRRFGGDVRHVRQDQSGVSSARNRGAELAHGDFVAFLDHDDAWLPTKLERQVEVLSPARATLALCAVSVVDRSGNVLHTKHLGAREDLVTGMLMFDGTETVSCSSTGLVRREEFLAMGGFDHNLSMSADWDLLLRALLEGGVAYVDEPLVRYRVHATNMSRDIGSMERDMSYAFAKAFANDRLPETLRRRRRSSYARLYRMLAGSYLDGGERTAAFRMLARSFRNDPKVVLQSIRDLRMSRRGSP
jgi:glycosyltransferase involved in cell wall biosynthesis